MLPKFLVVGAAKSGTTSLYNYLNQHPEIFMCPIKEPKFLTSTFLNFPHNGPSDTVVDKNIVRNIDEYKRLFKDARRGKIAGEASADTLYYYEQAIPNIKKFLGDEVKIIIILRNPVERALSAYLHLVRDNREQLSFEAALKDENSRQKKNWEFIWFYKDVGLYYNQVKAYLNAFGSDKVKIYLFKDFKVRTLYILKDIFRFLQVDDNFKPDISIPYNVSGMPKYKRLHNFIRRPYIVKIVSKILLPRNFSENIGNRLRIKINNKILYKPKMDKEVKQNLIKFFENDIKNLERLIQKDLSSWLQ